MRKLVVQRILVTASIALGDAVLFMPVLRTLRTAYPNAEIDIVLNHALPAATLRRTGLFSRVLVLDNLMFAAKTATGWRRLFLFAFGCCRHAARVAWIGGLVLLRRYDLALGHYNSTLPDLALITVLSGARVRVGPVRKRKWWFPSGVIYTTPIAFDEQKHLGEANLDLLDCLGLKLPPERYWWPVFDVERQWAEQLLHRRGVSRQHTLVVIAPSVGQYRWKQWPMQRFAELAVVLAADPRWFVVFVGAAERRWAAPAAENIIDLVGMTTVDQTAALIERADGVVANDSGPAHMAAALGIPVVAIFGPTDPALVRPIGKGRSRVVAARVSCAPCFSRNETAAPEKCDSRRCLATISVDEVKSALLEVMEDGGAGA